MFRAKSKKFSCRFLRIYRPQSEHFRFVIYRSGRFYRIKITSVRSKGNMYVLFSEYHTSLPISTSQ
ncbi:DUF1661 domain-containing protein [Porphyromonas gulae]|uniref:DUF1661 domain-containing protein n=1 Tax=Porphyromonas gulae TaxID=111105 RepID=UPI003742E449